MQDNLLQIHQTVANDITYSQSSEEYKRLRKAYKEVSVEVGKLRNKHRSLLGFSKIQSKHPLFF